LLLAVHRDERGQVSIETVLIVAAIALPILIFLYKFAWPRIRDMFNSRLNEFSADPPAAR
jgi:F0F1-type ATP synthase membrane subunit b/b'